ncbi:uncharacterized protein LOC143037300 [Oratosquilla oratoria]|uniref:uncharacterized protein LOC143037300 n=1 Tax=Oratosquilla oratoria TaxID=337810 RepID=UPI003F7623B0
MAIGMQRPKEPRNLRSDYRNRGFEHRVRSTSRSPQRKYSPPTIVAYRDSPTYNLASYLAKLLRPLVTNSPYMLQNSTDFIERIKGLNLRRGDALVSFDVQSIFTSIPRELVKSALKSAMEENRGFLANQKLSLSELMGLVSLCLDSTYFRFRDYTYDQRKGTPMGSVFQLWWLK